MLVLSALALRCYVFAACLGSEEGAAAHDHVTPSEQGHRHGDDAHGSHHHEQPTAPGPGGNHQSPVECCNATGICAFTVSSQAPSNEPVLHIVAATSPPDALNPTAFEHGRRLSRAVAHGPPTYLRLATLLI